MVDRVERRAFEDGAGGGAIDDRVRKVEVDDLDAKLAAVPPDKLRAVDAADAALEALGPSVEDRVPDNVELDDLVASPKPEDLEDRLLGAVIPEVRAPTPDVVAPLLPDPAAEMEVEDDFGRRREAAPISAASRPINLVSLRSPRAGSGATGARTGCSRTLAGVGRGAGVYASSSLRIYSSKSSFKSFFMHAAISLHNASIGSASIPRARCSIFSEPAHAGCTDIPEFNRRFMDVIDPERCKVAGAGRSDAAVVGRVDIDRMEAEDVGRETGKSIS